jgi:hypothetical protein
MPNDAEPIDDATWTWLSRREHAEFSGADRADTICWKRLTEREEWQLIRKPRHPRSGSAKTRAPWPISGPGRSGTGLWAGRHDRRSDRLWTAALSRSLPRGLRRYVPVWENRKYMAPCEASCPTGIPVQDRWRLVRDGRVDEAVDLALAYTPFPATVCGYLCPNLCMKGAPVPPRGRPSWRLWMSPSSVAKASIKAKAPKLPPMSGTSGWPLSAAVLPASPWLGRYALLGHEAVVLRYHGRDRWAARSPLPSPTAACQTRSWRKRWSAQPRCMPHVHLQQATQDPLSLTELN